MNLNAEDYFVAQQAERKVKELRERWRDRLVTITQPGKYNGYKGVVTDVQLQASTGRWLFLVYVIRKDGTDTLNSDPATRIYRPMWHFAVDGGKWRPTSREAKNTKPDDIWFGGEQ